MDARIEKRGAILLAGMGFYGNPFTNAGGWDEENEIGALWKRLMDYFSGHPEAFPGLGGKIDFSFEVHIPGAETERTGRYEVFAGFEVPSVNAIAGLPALLSAKALPRSEYAAITLQGEEIRGDWAARLYGEIVPGLGRRADRSFSFERYDSRFKGMDRLMESAIECWVPLLAPGDR
jgi:predicted transcriptional regulator YdeE